MPLKLAPISKRTNYLKLMEDDFVKSAELFINEADSTDLIRYTKTKHRGELLSVTKMIPTLFHRRWIVASIRGHLKQVRLAIKYQTQNQPEQARKHLDTSYLWLGQAIRIHDLVLLMRSMEKPKLASLSLTKDDLEPGDIVISYKTKEYVRRSPVSLLVKLASNSAMTHVMLATKTSSGDALLLNSGDETKGLGLKQPDPREHEVFLVMNFKNAKHYERLSSIIDTWHLVAENRENQNQCYDRLDFGELKCQTASLIGVATILATYLGIPLSLSNPFKNRRGVFCSELVDNILKEADIQIAPRSERDSVVGPVEFFYSPLLEFKGVICSSNTIEDIQKEIKEQFK